MCHNPQIFGVVCEYNPFHNGHQFLIRQIHAAGGVAVAVMSGALVQRGEPAAVDKRARVRSALRGGADLVLELPAVWACAGAETFAAGGVSVLNGLGCVDFLAYGCEHPNAALHRRVAELLDSPDFTTTLHNRWNDGRPFAAARQDAVADLLGAETAALLRCPNDTLAVEYHKALRRLDCAMRAFPVARVGAAHDGAPSGGIASASHIRSMLTNGADPAEYLPAAALREITDAIAAQGGVASTERMARTALYRLRTADPAEIALLPEVSEGLEHRLIAAARTAHTIAELYDACKSKRYSHARIRRIVLAMLMGCSAADRALPVPYIRVLGLRDGGRMVLRRARHTAKLPIVTRPTEIERLGADARHVFALECAATELWGLCCPVIPAAGAELTGEVCYVPTGCVN